MSNVSLKFYYYWCLASLRNEGRMSRLGDMKSCVVSPIFVGCKSLVSPFSNFVIIIMFNMLCFGSSFFFVFFVLDASRKVGHQLAVQKNALIQ